MEKGNNMTDLNGLKCCGNCIFMYQLPDGNENRCSERKEIEVFAYGCCDRWQQDGMSQDERMEWGDNLGGID